MGQYYFQDTWKGKKLSRSSPAGPGSQIPATFSFLYVMEAESKANHA